MDVHQAEVEAGAHFAATATGFGQLPNPQTYAEGAQLGVSPLLSNAALSGNLAYGTLLPASPLGAPASMTLPAQNTTSAVSGVTIPAASDPVTFDPAQYQQQLSLLDNPLLRQGPGMNADLGGPPVPSLNYVSWMNQRLGGDSQLAQKWQQQLANTGFLDHNHPTDGRWDSASAQAFTSWMTARFLPQAIYGKPSDDATRAASYFLTHLNGWDPSTLPAIAKADPKKKHDVFMAYFASFPTTLSPEQQRQVIGSYGDNLGDDALPDAVRDLKPGGWFSQLVDNTLGTVESWGEGLNHLIFHGGLEHQDPDTGQTISQAGTLLDLIPNAVLSHSFSTQDYRSVLAQRINGSMTSNDKQILAGPVSDVANAQGFLGGALSAYGQQVTRMQLAFIYSLGHSLNKVTSGDLSGLLQAAYTATTPIVNAYWNPFDTDGSIINGAIAHQDNFLSGLVGEQWTRDHPDGAFWINTVAGLADPTIVGAVALRPVKLASELAAVNRGLAALDKEGAAARASAALREAGVAGAERDLPRELPTTRPTSPAQMPGPAVTENPPVPALASTAPPGTRISATTRDYFHSLIQPKRVLNDVAKQVVQALLDHPDTPPDVLASALGISGHSGLRELTSTLYTEAGRNELRGAEAMEAVKGIAPFIAADNWHAAISSVGTAYNMRRAMAALHRSTKLSGEGLQRIIAVGGMPDYGDLFDLSGPGANEIRNLLDTWRFIGARIGLDSNELEGSIRQFILGDSGQRQAIFDAFYNRAMEYARTYEPGFESNLAKVISKTRFKNITERLEEEQDVEAQAATTAALPLTRTPGASKRLLKLEDQLDSARGMLKKFYMDKYREATGREPASLGEAQAWFKRNRKRYASAEAEFHDAIDNAAAKVTKERERVGTLSPDELAREDADFHQAPFSLYEFEMALNPALRNSELLLQKAHLGQALSVWKTLAVANPATLVRALLGDDILRFSVELAAMGVPGWENVLANAMAAPVLLGKHILGGLGHGGLGVKREFSLAKMDRLLRAAQDDPKAVMQLRQKFGLDTGDPSAFITPADRALVNRSSRDVWEAVGGTGLIDRPAGSRAYTLSGNVKPGEGKWMAGIARAIKGVRGDHLAQQWAATEHATQAAARNAIKHSLLDKTKKGGFRYDNPTFREKLATYTAQHHQYYNNLADELQDRLDAADIRAAGNPDSPEYLALPSRLPDRATGPKNRVGASTRTQRERVLARIREYRKQASDDNHAVDEYVARIESELRHFFAHPKLKAILRDPDKQLTADNLQALLDEKSDLLPNVSVPSTAPPRVPNYPGAVSGFAQAFLDHVFSSGIAGARAYGAKKMFDWWMDWVDRYHPEWGNELVPEGSGTRKADFAAAKAQEWMRNNTYQATRTIGDLALRAPFPFIGATMSMDRFWMRQLSAHPWAIGPVAKAGAAVGDPNEGFNIPLGWLGMGSSQLHLNPLASIFYSNEGYASLVPGPGPVLTMFEDIARQDPDIASLLDQIPGQGAGQAYAPTLAPGAVGKAINIASDISVSRGGPAFSLGLAGGGTVRTQEDYNRLIAERGRQDVAAGKTVEQAHDAARGEVGLGTGLRDAVSLFAPVAPQTQDPRAISLSQARTAYDNARTPQEKQQVLADFPDAAPLLQYVDPDTPPTVKDAIEANPDTAWVVPYSTSLYETQGSKPGTLPEFQAAQATGNLHVMGPDEYFEVLSKAMDKAQGFTLYRSKYVPTKQQYDALIAQMKAQGISTSDPRYQAISAERQDVLSAIETDIREHYPGWWDAFQGGSVIRSLASEQINSAPIAALSGYDLLPFIDHTADPEYIAVQNLIRAKDEAAANMATLRENGGSQQDLDAQVTWFKNQVNAIGAEYPQLSGLLDIYHFGRWQDFLNLGVTADYQAATGLR